ncbi:IDEAL domain-containing protein [Bacillus sp. B15-48]|uniref:IDEAL domain-containing protein n=1 Tax=Bacillus sp. B15-48 TaxID=1548601 RepID=UPI00193F7ADA|nr:IDEAL domain-containing protein [Bacillus sp. B15-48]MBM4761009.1 IDEAL domain-containing protein [Bacillus sp. B15-48]
MEKKTLNTPKHKLINMPSLFAEMVLDQALRDFKKEKLQQKIDQSLQRKNKKEFMRLTEELKKLS